MSDAKTHTESVDITVDDVDAAIDETYGSLSTVDRMILRVLVMHRLTRDTQPETTVDCRINMPEPQRVGAEPNPADLPVDVFQAEAGTVVRCRGFSRVGVFVRHERAYDTDWAVVQWSDRAYTSREIPSALVLVPPSQARVAQRPVVDVNLPEVS